MATKGDSCIRIVKFDENDPAKGIVAWHRFGVVVEFEALALFTTRKWQLKWLERYLIIVQVYLETWLLIEDSCEASWRALHACVRHGVCCVVEFERWLRQGLQFRGMGGKKLFCCIKKVLPEWNVRTCHGYLRTRPNVVYAVVFHDQGIHQHKRDVCLIVITSNEVMECLRFDDEWSQDRASTNVDKAEPLTGCAFAFEPLLRTSDYELLWNKVSEHLNSYHSRQTATCLGKYFKFYKDSWTTTSSDFSEYSNYPITWNLNPE